MCGIAGILDWERPPDPRLAEAMSVRLEHRGPDDSGIEVCGPLVLAHRRLTIIDLTSAGHQPMADVEGRLRIVYNGEIYNYRELRAELIGRGARFASESDTEVILEAYKAWDLGCLERLNGMFAFALWDQPARRLLLARDRLGEKPLFLSVSPSGVVFASELKALRAHPAVSDRLSPRALGQFLSFNYVAGDACILDGVEKLAPAHAMVFEAGRAPRRFQYWDLAAAFRAKRRFASIDEGAAALAAALDDSVRLRLVSDVPLGAFLSGGCDSSAVAASMCAVGSPAETRTFSMGFREETYSELEEARFVAGFLGVSHADALVEAQMARALPLIVAAADEPFADTSAIPVYFLAEFARRRVKVCLSGDGADEILAGYPTHLADRLRELTRWVPAGLVSLLARVVDAAWPVSFGKVSLDYKLRHFLRGHGLDAARAHCSWRTIFSEDQKRALLRPEVAAEVLGHDPFDPFRVHFERVADLEALDQFLYVDIKTWLPDDILVKLDRQTMVHSLEARTPFLDHHLVELSAGLPAAWKLGRLRGKRVLKRSQARRLPRRTLRRRKAGFNAPVSSWLNTSLRELAEVARSPAMGEWIRPDQVDRLAEEHRLGVHDHGHRLFGLTCLGLWLEQHRACSAAASGGGS
jgi:asparagine synthase (glutamine-hydrolysing)